MPGPFRSSFRSFAEDEEKFPVLTDADGWQVPSQRLIHRDPEEDGRESVESVAGRTLAVPGVTARRQVDFKLISRMNDHQWAINGSTWCAKDMVVMAVASRISAGSSAYACTSL